MFVHCDDIQLVQIDRSVTLIICKLAGWMVFISLFCARQWAGKFVTELRMRKTTVQITSTGQRRRHQPDTLNRMSSVFCGFAFLISNRSALCWIWAHIRCRPNDKLTKVKRTRSMENCMQLHQAENVCREKFFAVSSSIKMAKTDWTTETTENDCIAERKRWSKIENFHLQRQNKSSVNGSS